MSSYGGLKFCIFVKKIEMFGWLVGGLVGWLVGCLACWPVGWLAGWLDKIIILTAESSWKLVSGGQHSGTFGCENENFGRTMAASKCCKLRSRWSRGGRDVIAR